MQTTQSAPGALSEWVAVAQPAPARTSISHRWQAVAASSSPRTTFGWCSKRI